MKGTRILSFHNFVCPPWCPWHGLTLGELYHRAPDAAFTLAAIAREHQCPPLLRNAINTFVQLRRLELAGRAPAGSAARRPERYVTV